MLRIRDYVDIATIVQELYEKEGIGYNEGLKRAMEIFNSRKDKENGESGHNSKINNVSCNSVE